MGDRKQFGSPIEYSRIREPEEGLVNPSIVARYGRQKKV